MKTQDLTLLVVPLLMSLPVSCNRLNGAKLPPPTEQTRISQEKLKELGKTMMIEFPKSTRAVGLLEEGGGMDSAIELKIEIKPEDLNEFISKSPFANTKLSSDRRSVTNLKDVSWWMPDNVKSFQSGQVRLPDAKVLNILIDRDKEDPVTIFLMWFST